MTETELRLQKLSFYMVSNLSIKGVVVVVVGVVELPEDFESVLSILRNYNKEDKPIGLHMRQCQIRVRFESGVMQFFKVLKKWF